MKKKKYKLNIIKMSYKENLDEICRLIEESEKLNPPISKEVKYNYTIQPYFLGKK